MAASPRDDEVRAGLIDAARDLLRDLHTARMLLDRIAEPLRRRVEVRMGTHLARAARRAEATLTSAQGIGMSAADLWAELHALRWEIDEVMEECLVLVTGCADRAMGYDDGYCTLADALVDELVARTPVGHWSSFTVVGRNEQYSRASRVIQVRFPPSSIWQLPVVAHELGHFVGPALVADQGLRGTNPLADLGTTAGDGSDQSWAWLEELFADAFATRLLGPAFGFTSVLTAFDPLMALVATPTHPAPHQRVGVITAMLKRAGQEQMTWAATRITAMWDGLVTASGGHEGRIDVGESPFRGGLVDLLDDLLPISAYDGWGRAQQAKAALLDTNALSDTCVVGLADILNGAWLARLESTSTFAIDEVDRRARELCHEVAKREA